MVKFMSYEDSYFDISKDLECATVIYGAGTYGKKVFPYLKNVSYICDKHADRIGKVNEVPVIFPQDLYSIEELFLIVICVKSEEIRREIKSDLAIMPINAYVFDYFDNVSFNRFAPKALEGSETGKEIHHIHLVCEDVGWILEKFAIKMREELEKQGFECSVSNIVDPSADINHHIIYDSWETIISYNDTLMITHIDSYNKLEMIKHQLKVAKMGICMSRETMEKLAVYGVPRQKLCYINPAQDGVIKPKKYVLGITSKTHDDHRKNENMLIQLCNVLDPDYFTFKIMGGGWNKIVDTVINMGFQVEYYDHFDYEKYTQLMPSLDYYLFWGFDEGSMGFLDALKAGVKTIVTPQGYHLDVKDGITHACRTLEDFESVLLKLQKKREKLVKSVDAWTWKNYVNKHLEIWNYLVGNERDIYEHQHMYEDGIFSVLRYNA